jgi:hypothetical protein
MVFTFQPARGDASKEAHRMKSLIDELAKVLASGASRRGALAGLAAVAAASLPWTAEGKSKKRKRRRRKKRLLEEFAPFLAYCEDWCSTEFQPEPKILLECISLAKTGQGACYEDPSAPGFVCTKELLCPAGFTCCPNIGGVGGDCCLGGCQAINGTLICA